MRTIFVFMALVLGTFSISIAQQSQPQLLSPSSVTVQATESPTAYVVNLAQYQIQSTLPTTQSADEIIEWIASRSEDEEFQPIETIRLSVLSDNESMVQFGRLVSVTTGTVSNPRMGTMRQSERVETGTSVRLTAKPLGDKIALKISFESSRLDGDPRADESPDVGTAQIDTTVLLELGKPLLLAGVTEQDSSLFVVTISH